MAKSELHPGTRAPGRPRSEAAERSIILAARSLLLSGGYSGMTFEGVARRAGVAKTTVYRRWKTHSDLALGAAANDISIGVVPDTGDSGRDLEIAIQQLIETFSRPIAAIVIFAAITPAAGDSALARAFRERFVYPWRVSAAAALERARQRGDLALEDVGFALDMVVGTVFQRTIVIRQPAVQGLAERLLAVILRQAQYDAWRLSRRKGFPAPTGQ